MCTSFLCFVVVDGTIFSMGRFLEEFEKHFNSSKSKTAWVASIMSGWYLLVGKRNESRLRRQLYV